MTTENETVTTDDTTTSEEVVTTTTEETKEQKTVSKAEFDKVLAEMHKHKKTAKELSDAKKADELKVLKEKQEWQKIAELAEADLKEARESKEKITRAVINDKKLAAIREVALKQGILETALDDVDLADWSEVSVETTSTGRINVNGVDDAVKRLKLRKPHWFGKVATKINTKVPETKNHEEEGIVTLEKLNKLRKEAMSKGDYSKYEPAFKKYQAQQK